MEFFFQILINGLSIGFLYALAALGFVMIFKSSSVLNFAHGELMAVGAFLFLVLTTWAKLPVWLAFILTLAGSFSLGFIIERFFLRPLIGEALIEVIMLTVGLAIMLKGLMLLYLAVIYTVIRIFCRSLLHFNGEQSKSQGFMLLPL